MASQEGLYGKPPSTEEKVGQAAGACNLQAAHSVAVVGGSLQEKRGWLQFRCLKEDTPQACTSQACTSHILVFLQVKEMNTTLTTCQVSLPAMVFYVILWLPSCRTE